MLHLGASHRSLDTFHQRFLDDGLPPELSRKAFAAFDRKAYARAELRWGREAWELRTLDEYRSQVAFTELLMELTELGCAYDILGTGVRVVRDEDRHVELCRRMVVALGGKDEIPGEPNYVRSEKELPLRQRALSTIVGSLCIGETVSVATLAAVRDVTVDPLARAVTKVLAADESVHSRFGWTLLELFSAAPEAGDREVIEATIPVAVAGARGAMVMSDEEIASDGGQTLNPFGYLGARARAALFHDVVERDVLRRFRALGYEASDGDLALVRKRQQRRHSPARRRGPRKGQ